MDNSELPREEQLVRLYELQHQLELYDAERFNALVIIGEGMCFDCGRTRQRRRYGSVALCAPCCMLRIRFDSVLAAERRRHGISA